MAIRCIHVVFLLLAVASCKDIVMSSKGMYVELDPNRGSFIFGRKNPPMQDQHRVELKPLAITELDTNRHLAHPDHVFDLRLKEQYHALGPFSGHTQGVHAKFSMFSEYAFEGETTFEWGVWQFSEAGVFKDDIDHKAFAVLPGDFKLQFLVSKWPFCTPNVYECMKPGATEQVTGRYLELFFQLVTWGYTDSGEAVCNVPETAEGLTFGCSTFFLHNNQALEHNNYTTASISPNATTTKQGEPTITEIKMVIDRFNVTGTTVQYMRLEPIASPAPASSGLSTTAIFFIVLTVILVIAGAAVAVYKYWWVPREEGKWRHPDTEQSLNTGFGSDEI